MSAELEAVDPLRCQADKQYYRPFQMGGKVRGWERCENSPTVIATERHAGSDGKRGSMSLCEECKAVFLKNLGEDRADFTPIGGTPA